MRPNFLTAVFLILAISFTQAQAQLKVAVAANAQFVMKALQAGFKKKTGIALEAITGSSGKLSEQIRNGAPYDLFLSADMAYPDFLYEQGLGLEKPREYALGSLIVCSASDVRIQSWKALLADPQTGKVAIANSATAPYGRAAEEALKHYGLLEKVKPRLVYGESISQVNTYITTSAVSLGFTTEALIYELKGKQRLYWTRIDPSVYGAIRQGAILLQYARKEHYTAAKRFYDYLYSAEAKAIFKRYGYLLP